MAASPCDAKRIIPAETPAFAVPRHERISDTHNREE
jgi:hypothetical protein